MRRLATYGAMALVACGVAHGEVIDLALENVLEQSAPETTVSALIYLQEQLDTAAVNAQMNAQKAKLKLRHTTVVTTLQEIAADTQGPLKQFLGDLKDAGDIVDYQAFWIGNIIQVEATPDMLRQIAKHPDIERMYYDFEIGNIDPFDGEPNADPLPVGLIEPGVEAVRAPEVWAMGITGEGRLVGTLDTGVDGNHPALASRWRGLDPAYAGNPGWAFFDPVTNWQFPQDSGSHGTHTMGSVCGGVPGNQIGVAPGAEWIHAAVIDRVSIPQTVADAILAFQWMIDPDGNPNTNFDVPDTCSNSWGVTTGHGYPNCDQTFWTFIDALEAAGTVVVFSAGNEGFSGLRRPADRATNEFNTLAVAAVNANINGWPIAGFSSRGPTFCTPDGSAAIKPDIAAPGENVISSVPGGGYSSFSGTSMASPHVNGVIAMMRQANPDISVEQVKQIIYDTAFDLGAGGEDNDYGHGMIDAFECVNAAIATASLTFSFPNGRPDFIDPAGGPLVQVVVTGQATTPQPDTGKLYISVDGGPYNEYAMNQTAPNEYDAIFPATPCGADVNYYFSAETTDAEVVTNPFSAPDSSYYGIAYVGTSQLYYDDFEVDNGWSVSGDAITGMWELGVPLGGGDRGDPAEDADGSGQAYLTDPADGDTDIDGGSTILTSYALDATDPEAVIAYSRWYNNTFGADPNNDIFVVDISDDDGATWTNLETVGPNSSPGWVRKEFKVSEIPGITNSSTIRLRFNASDLNAGSVVEAGVDGLEIFRFECGDDGIVGDVDMDGDVDIQDLLAMLADWGCNGPDCVGDVDGDGDTDISDLLTLLANWTG